MMRLLFITFTCFSTIIYAVSISSTDLGGCSTHCSVAFDKDLGCFNKTLAFFEGAVLGVMRNFVATQKNIALIHNTNGSPSPSVDQMVQQAKKAMKKVKPMNTEDEEGLLNVDDASDIVRVLAKQVIVQAPPSQTPIDVVCPSGCEQGSSPWLPLFLASVALNIVLFALSATTMLLTTRRDEKNATRLFQESLAHATLNGLKTD